MTKTYEETIRGTLAELVQWADSTEVLGEITLVIAGGATGSAARLLMMQLLAYESMKPLAWIPKRCDRHCR
jgi:16S rRNA C1402 (ribose-2'-O) methylase RsmI